MHYCYFSCCFLVDLPPINLCLFTLNGWTVAVSSCLASLPLVLLHSIFNSVCYWKIHFLKILALVFVSLLEETLIESLLCGLKPKLLS